jgi:outer membrane protein W
MLKRLQKLALTITAAALPMMLAPVVAQDAGAQNIIKAGYGGLFVNDDSGDLTGPSTLPGITVDVDDTENLSVSYTRLFGDRFGIELLAGIPFDVDIDADGVVAGAGKVATANAAAPTLLFNYYFTPANAKTRPYVALAVNHTFFYDEEATPTLNGLLSGDTSLDFDSSTGVGVFGGVNYQLSEKYLVSGLLGYVEADTTVSLDTDTIVDVGGVPTNVGIVSREIDVDLNPYYLFLSVGRKF